jgi:hypothetical protein
MVRSNFSYHKQICSETFHPVAVGAFIARLPDDFVFNIR